MLQVVTVGRVTSPVTQVAVVAVKRASIYDTEDPFFVLIGKESKKLPRRMANKKLNKISCVVLIRTLFFT